MGKKLIFAELQLSEIFFRGEISNFSKEFLKDSSEQCFFFFRFTGRNLPVFRFWDLGGDKIFGKFQKNTFFFFFFAVFVKKNVFSKFSSGFKKFFKTKKKTLVRSSCYKFGHETGYKSGWNWISNWLRICNPHKRETKEKICMLNVTMAIIYDTKTLSINNYKIPFLICGIKW